jgi:hypothetical protein
MPVCGSGAFASSSALLIRGHLRRCQAETPLIPLSRFSGPALWLHFSDCGNFVEVVAKTASLDEATFVGVIAFIMMLSVFLWEQGITIAQMLRCLF